MEIDQATSSTPDILIQLHPNIYLDMFCSIMSIRPLSSALQKKAEVELQEVPNRVQEDIKHLQEWLTKQPHLRARTDEQWLLSFLRGCKFSLQRTKEKLDLFYTMRSLIPEFFSNRDPLLPEIQEVLNRGILLILPQTTGETGPRIMIFRTGRADPDTISIATFTKVMLMVLDILYMEDDDCVVSGLSGIMDLQDLPYKYLPQLTPSYLKKVIACFQNAYPTRLKGLHLINFPSYFEPVYKLTQVFLTEKLKKRVQLHNDLDNLHKIIPLSVLPKEYGGDGKSCDEITDEWKLKVENYRNWFLEDSQYGTNETKRLGKQKNCEHIFNVEGSFRKLEID